MKAPNYSQPNSSYLIHNTYEYYSVYRPDEGSLCIRKRLATLIQNKLPESYVHSHPKDFITGDDLEEEILLQTHDYHNPVPSADEASSSSLNIWSGVQRQARRWLPRRVFTQLRSAEWAERKLYRHLTRLSSLCESLARETRVRVVVFIPIQTSFSLNRAFLSNYLKIN